MKRESALVRAYRRDNDLERVLSRLHNDACELAEAAGSRARIAHQLRETARLIDAPNAKD